ncbi:hypothetical protein HDU78_008505, partial [Chytriomyces hyalinus]
MNAATHNSELGGLLLSLATHLPATTPTIQLVQAPKFKWVSSVILTFHALQHKQPSPEQARLYGCLDAVLEQCDQITFEVSALANLVPVLIMDGHFDDLPAGNTGAAEFVERQKLQMQLEGAMDMNDRQMLHLREVVGVASFFQSCLSLVSKEKEGTLVSDKEDLKFLEGRTHSQHPIMMEAARQYLQKGDPALPIPHRTGMGNIITAESD